MTNDTSSGRGTPVRTERLFKGTDAMRGRDAEGMWGDTIAVTMGWHELAVTPGLAGSGHRAEWSAHLGSLYLQTSSLSLQPQPDTGALHLVKGPISHQGHICHPCFYTTMPGSSLIYMV